MNIQRYFPDLPDAIVSATKAQLLRALPPTPRTLAQLYVLIRQLRGNNYRLPIDLLRSSLLDLPALIFCIYVDYYDTVIREHSQHQHLLAAFRKGLLHDPLYSE